MVLTAPFRPARRLFTRTIAVLAAACSPNAGGPAPTAPSEPPAPTDLSAPGTVRQVERSSDAAPRRRAFPDTTSRIAILADQLLGMNDAQTRFAATHFVGTQKVYVPVTRALRAVHPDFLVLHYHLAMWQSAPEVPLILDGRTFGNDHPLVTTHEDWFWHDAAGARVASTSDGKFLMNVSVPAFQDYWASSIAAQTAAGEYDAVFLDSASPALLQGEAGARDPRLAGTAVRERTFAELGGTTWTRAWETWIAKLDASLGNDGIPLIVNTGPLITTWDDTDYGRSAGAFSEGFAGRSWPEADWRLATNALLRLSRAGKIVILQNYLRDAGDVATRRWYLANYLLVKGTRTYLDYFAGNPLEWYPEWDLDLGAPAAGPAASADDLVQDGVFRRDFALGVVLVNPSERDVTVALGTTMRRVIPVGGGAIDASGAATGSIATQDVSSITVPAKGAEILYR